MQRVHRRDEATGQGHWALIRPDERMRLPWS